MIINEGTMLAMATALVSVCEPRGCASATQAARQLSCRTSGQCSATATALVSACKPRGCACDYSSSPCLRMSTLSLQCPSLYDSRQFSFSFFLGVPSVVLVTRLHPVLQWFPFRTRCMSPAAAPHTPPRFESRSESQTSKDWVLK